MPKIKTPEPVKKKTPSALSIPVYDLKGTEVGTTELNKDIFSVKDNDNLLTQYIRVYLANQRQGNASAKTRGEVIGSTKKIYKQKGTGRARHGSRKAPIFVGGGVVGGPKPKDHSLKINKKQKKLAMFLSLSKKAKLKGLIGLDEKAADMEPKTKNLAAFLKKMELSGKKVLFVIPQLKKNNFILAARNLAGVGLANAASINPYIILNHDKIIFVEPSLKVIETHFLKNEN